MLEQNDEKPIFLIGWELVGTLSKEEVGAVGRASDIARKEGYALVTLDY